MKKLLFFACLFAAQLTFAEDVRTMYIYDDRGYIYPYAVAAIDSIMFEKLEPSINIAPKHVTIRKGEQARVEAQLLGVGWRIPNYPYSPNPTTWSLSDSNIAAKFSASPSSFATSACMIEGLRVGTTTLTVTCGELSSSIDVEVLPMAISETINDGNIAEYTQSAYNNLIYLHDHWGYWSLSELTTDECICPVRNPGGNWNDGGYWRDLHAHNDISAHSYSCHTQIWRSTIEGFAACNAALDNIKHSSASAANKQSATCELEVLRSLYGYVLLDSYGAFSFTDEEYVPNNIGQYKPACEIWSSLVACLERNAPNLPKVTDANRLQYVGRVTQGLAYSLLARLYLNAESFGCTPQNVAVAGVDIISTNDFYTNAIRCCDKVIASGAYAIEDSYFTNFKIKNESSKENIFVLVEDGTIKNEVWYWNLFSKARLQLLTLPYAMQQAWNMIEQPWNGMAATQSFIKRFEYGKDKRGLCDTIQGTDDCEGFGWFAGPVKKDGQVLKDLMWTNEDVVISTKITSMSNATHNDGARIIKYEVDKTGTYRYMENDFVLFRFADVLYMKAEAILRGGQGASLTTLLNDASFKKIRQRAGVTPYSTLKLDELLDERGREFYWECVRRRDLIRFNKYNDPKYIDFLENTTPSDGFAPIPKEAVANEFTQTGVTGVYLAVLGEKNEPEKQLFARGINEMEYSYREGMYEKYAYLEAGKRYALVVTEGPYYGVFAANLEQKTLQTDNTAITGYYGLAQETISAMTIPNSGLYHIIIDTNNGSFNGAQVFVVPTEWGIRGAMNGWWWSAADEQTMADGMITWSWKNVKIQSDNAEFNFTHGAYWKILLDNTGLVVVSAGLRAELNPVGSNIVLDTKGIYDITLTYRLAGGDIANSFEYMATRTGDIPIPNYSDVELELVGDAVADQIGATKDPSSWGWGNVYSLGKPTKDGNIYTWKSATKVKLRGGYSYKVRTKNFQSQGSIEAFDNGRDLYALQDGDYSLTVTIDAESGAMTVDDGYVAPDPVIVTVKAKMPTDWTNTPTAWVWPTGGDGQTATLTQDGDWWVYTTPSPVIALNIIWRNGNTWDNGQTVNVENLRENACYTIGNNNGKRNVTAVDCP